MYFCNWHFACVYGVYLFLQVLAFFVLVFHPIHGLDPRGMVIVLLHIAGSVMVRAYYGTLHTIVSISISHGMGQ